MKKEYTHIRVTKKDKEELQSIAKAFSKSMLTLVSEMIGFYVNNHTNSVDEKKNVNICVNTNKDTVTEDTTTKDYIITTTLTKDTQEDLSPGPESTLETVMSFREFSLANAGKIQPQKMKAAHNNYLKQKNTTKTPDTYNKDLLPGAKNYI